MGDFAYLYSLENGIDKSYEKKSFPIQTALAGPSTIRCNAQIRRIDVKAKAGARAPPNVPPKTPKMGFGGKLTSFQRNFKIRIRKFL